MIYLIDAYNLMHAVGYLHRSTPLNRMESSRRRLLDWLATFVKSRPNDRFHVVFDAKSAPRPSESSVYRGIDVSFAYRESADDFLERLLKSAAPGTVTLVSNDTIIQSAATKSRSEFLPCSAFVDRLLEPPDEGKHGRSRKATVQRNSDEAKPESDHSSDEYLAIFSEPNQKRRK